MGPNLGRTTSRRSVLVAVVCGLLGAGLLVIAFGSDTPPRPSLVVPGLASPSPQVSQTPKKAAGRQGPSRTRGAGMADLVTGPVLPAARPLTISIPRLQVASRLESLSLDGRGAMEVPADPARAGWYRLGPTPGALGPAVIAGHVTWNQVPAVFFALADLRPGDVVRVARRDGRVAVFGVTRVERHAKSAFPTESVFGAIDHAGLRLITCGGEFDSSSHWYHDNVVVFARLTSAT